MASSHPLRCANTRIPQAVYMSVYMSMYMPFLIVRGSHKKIVHNVYARRKRVPDTILLTKLYHFPRKTSCLAGQDGVFGAQARGGLRAYYAAHALKPNKWYTAA